MTQAAIECVFFDCDDCLYKNDWATMRALTAKISEYTETNLGLSGAAVYDLFKKHGTTLCGLVKEGHLAASQVDDFLEAVHDVPLEFEADPKLRSILRAIPYPRWVFTASTPGHAKRCLERLGIQDMFRGIISASSRTMIDEVGYVSKHDPRCFAKAMQIAGVPKDKASGCLFFDDSVSNLRTAKSMGWRTVLVGLHARDTGARIECKAADLEVETLHEIPVVLPELFMSPFGKVPKQLDDAVLITTKRARVIKPIASSPDRRVRRKASEADSPQRA